MSEPKNPRDDDEDGPKKAPERGTNRVASERKGRRHSGVRKTVAVVGGLIVGVAIAEGLFYLRDDGAFPHLNVYQADEKLGVRLRPGATQRVKFGGAEATDVRINAAGFRGEAWPSPGPDEVLVVGDSQVFGLGVQENETLPVALSAVLGGKTVLNAGVPTWGPIEYNMVIEELAGQRKPKLVVLVLNVFNDPFESDRPNIQRHKVWDGWAVRHETAPPSTYAFPGRSWIYGNSHAFFALRRLIYGRGPEANRLGMPSEGAWDELLTEASGTRDERARAATINREMVALREDEIAHAADALLASQMYVEKVANDLVPHQTSEGDVSLSTARATPGDIVDYGDGGEFARPGPVTAAHIKLATRLRNEVEQKLLELARQKADEARSKDIVRTLEQQNELEKRLAELRESPARVVRAMSPLARRVEETKKICDAAGADLIVVAIPMDVQVSADEWQKYGHAPMDMEPTRVMLTDVVEAAETLGAKGLDATDALRAAGPGAFLPRDLHLTAKGHKALAEAIAKRLEQHDPKQPRGGLPHGRSRLPRLDEWNSVGETHVVGSTMRGCITKRIREWVALWCGQSDPFQGVGAAATGVKVLKGGHDETIIARWDGPKYDWVGGEYVPGDKTETKTVLVAPVLAGDELVAEFYWPTKKSTLIVRFPEDVSKQVVAFQKFVKEPSEPMPISPAAKELCECHKKGTGADGCMFLVAQPDEDCKRTYGEDCKSLLACSSGDPLYAPKCKDGFAHGGALERCYPLCGPNRACTTGVCSNWQGGELCMPEGSAPSGQSAPTLRESPRVGDLSQKVIDLSREVVTLAKKLTESCELVNADKGSYYFDVYDQCPYDEKGAASLSEAVKSLQSHLDANPADRAGEAAILVTRSVLLAEWLDLARRRRTGRGLLVRFAELVDVWNRWQPSSKVPAYTDKVLEQYRTGKRTKGKAAAQETIVWQRCRSGPCL